VTLIDSGEAAAEVVAHVLLKENLSAQNRSLEFQQLSENRSLCDDLDHFYVTDAAERFARVAERFLGTHPARLEAIELWGKDELHTN
jgi:glutamate racemase